MSIVLAVVSSTRTIPVAAFPLQAAEPEDGAVLFQFQPHLGLDVQQGTDQVLVDVGFADGFGHRVDDLFGGSQFQAESGGGDVEL